jgi:hypothetical protein
MALDSLESDLQAGRLQTAKSKLAALRKQWSVFESEAGFRGQAIGNIMVAFSQLDIAAGTNRIAEPDGPANRGQPVAPETNRASGAPGSGG